MISDVFAPLKTPLSSSAISALIMLLTNYSILLMMALLVEQIEVDMSVRKMKAANVKHTVLADCEIIKGILRDIVESMDRDETRDDLLDCWRRIERVQTKIAQDLF
jgi:hypothetical protein